MEEITIRLPGMLAYRIASFAGFVGRSPEEQIVLTLRDSWPSDLSYEEFERRVLAAEAGYGPGEGTVMIRWDRDYGHSEHRRTED